MNKAMKRAKFLKSLSALAKSSRPYIERLWKIGTDVSKFGISMVSFVSSILTTLAKAAVQATGLDRRIRELSVTRFMFLPPSDLWSGREAPSEEEPFLTEMSQANVSFLFNVTVARKTAAELARRAIAKTPKPALLQGPASLPDAGLTQDALRARVKAPAETVSGIVAKLQSRLKLKLTPIIEGVSSAFQEYDKHAIFPALPRPLLAGPQSLMSSPSLPLAEPLEREIVHVSLPRRPSAAIPRGSSLPREKARAALPLLVPTPVIRLRPMAARSFGYATRLPDIVVEQEASILKRLAAFSFVSPPKPPLPSTELPHRYPKPTTLPSIRPSQVGRLLKDIAPSLTSWIYGVSEVLRGTSLSLSAVPVAASTAEKVVTEALVQPVSSLETPGILHSQEPVSHGLRSAGSDASVGRTNVEAFRLPAIVASLVVALRQRYPPILGEPTIGGPSGTIYEPMGVVPEESPALGRIPDDESFSKLPTVIALAAAESLIAYRLQHEFSVLTRQIQVARSSSGEGLSPLDTFGPIKPPVRSELGAIPAAPLSPTLRRYASGIPSPPRRVGRESGSPAIQNTFNITVSAESAEEDLRDLERKISRILSRQIRRYYGSART